MIHLSSVLRALRRVYVELLAAGAVLVTVVAVVTWVGDGGPAWAWAAGAWFAAIGSVAGSKVWVARDLRRADLLWGLVGAGAVLGAAGAGGPGVVAAAVAGLAGQVGFVTWYARQHRPTGPLAVGDRLPDAPLVRLDGTATSLSELAGRPHVIVFHRGSWCPFCVVQVRDLAARYRDLDRRGYQVALISPQPAADTAALAADLDVPMAHYVDRDGAAAQALDLVQSGGLPATYGRGQVGDTVVPTVVITDAEGVVRWLRHSSDHRDRPDAATLLDVIDHGLRSGVDHVERAG